MAEAKKSIFDTLSRIDVSGKVETKNNLSYLSWAWAWAEFKKVYPEAKYEVIKFDGKPYFYDEALGYMCYTSVTVNDLTHEMWLPVMDSTNRAMKAQPYTFKDRWNKERRVEAATMYDINKTIMRCLTKNLAMFGLGLSLYAGEDLYEEDTPRSEKGNSESSRASSKPMGVKCSDCGQIIKDYQGHSAAKIAEATAKKYGVPICMECSAKRRAKAEEEKKKAEAQEEEGILPFDLT